jgi:hypothetical protein
VDAPRLPRGLSPVDDVEIDLGQKKQIVLKRFGIEFSRCLTPANMGLDEGYAAHPQVTHERDALFPELALLSLFQKEGWDGAWADTAHRKFFTIMPNKSKGITLDARVNQTLARISGASAAGRCECWSLVLWQGKTQLFIEMLESAADGSFRRGRLEWLRAALRCGLSQNQFIVVEWSYRKTVVVRARRRRDR